MKEKIKKHLNIIYDNVFSKDEINNLTNEILNLIDKWKEKISIKHLVKITQENVYLIVYGNSFYSQDKKISPLKDLHKFINTHLKNVITDVHILPHFSSSSDDGFSIIDYYKVDPDLGTWDDILEMKEDVNLMFDFVINHVSSQSKWFKNYLKGNKKYLDFFIEKNNDWNYEKVVRPRENDLFTKFNDVNNKVHYLWTTFSYDQVDLNFKSKNVLLKSIDILLTYISYGVRTIRLDAIGFLWKENNSLSINLPQTHEIIKLWRTILDEVSNKHIILITETNVPFKENISYFGDGDEAHLIYNFPFPPLVIHTFLEGDASTIMKKMNKIIFINDNKNKISFFNFLSSHDGIGMRPVEGILNQNQIKKMSDLTIKKGGKISYTKINGKKRIYELNITFYSLLEEQNDSEEMNINRFIASIFLLLSMIGIPAIYYNLLLGSKNYVKGVEETKINRRINREKYDLKRVDSLLNNSNYLNSKIFNKIKELILIRKKEEAFYPFGKQKPIFIKKELITFIREHKDQEIFVALNVTKKDISFSFDIKGIDLLTNININKQINLKPYQCMWIKKFNN